MRSSTRSRLQGLVDEAGAAALRGLIRLSGRWFPRRERPFRAAEPLEPPAPAGAKRAKARVRPRDLEERVVRVCAHFLAGVTSREIAELLGERLDRVRPTVGRLLTHREIFRFGEPRHDRWGLVRAAPLLARTPQTPEIVRQWVRDLAREARDGRLDLDAELARVARAFPELARFLPRWAQTAFDPPSADDRRRFLWTRAVPVDLVVRSDVDRAAARLPLAHLLMVRAGVYERLSTVRHGAESPPVPQRRPGPVLDPLEEQRRREAYAMHESDAAAAAALRLSRSTWRSWRSSRGLAPRRGPRPRHRRPRRANPRGPRAARRGAQ